MSALAILGAFAVIFVTGLGVTRWLLKDADRTWWIELFGCAWLFGSAAISVFLALGGLVARGPVLVVSVSFVGVALGLAGLRAAAGRARPQWFPVGTKGWEIALSMLPLLPLAWLSMQTFRETLHWDGLFVWEVKARLAFLNDGAIPRSYFSDPLLLWSHPGYPLYLPMLDLWVYLWLGETHQFWLKALFPLFYFAAAGVLWSAGLRLTGRVWIGAVAALLLFAVPRAIGARAGVLQGYADFPLAILYLSAFVALLLGASGERAWLRVAAAASAVLPWVKQEGLVLWASFALAAVWLCRREGRTAVALVLPGFCTVLSWQAFLGWVEVAHETTFQPLTVETLRSNVPRLLPLLQRFGEELLRIRYWSLLWPLTAVALAALAWRRRRSALPLAIALLAPLACDLIPYVFTTIQPWQMHVETSLDRLVLQLVPVAVLALALVLGDGKNPKLQSSSTKEAPSHKPQGLVGTAM